MNNYKPELGQAVFGQPFKQFECPDWVEAFLRAIESELGRVQWNLNQEEYSSPFGNTGNKYKNHVFEVEAYDWDEEREQPYNFKWRDLEIGWYKYCGRGMSMNRELTPDEGVVMLNECLSSVRAEDRDILEEAAKPNASGDAGATPPHIQ